MEFSLYHGERVQRVIGFEQVVQRHCRLYFRDALETVWEQPRVGKETKIIADPLIKLLLYFDGSLGILPYHNSLP